MSNTIDDTVPLPQVAIIGKPNVGKSTLFNRFVGHREAIESQIPGTTRDSISYGIEAKIPFELLDVAGIVDRKNIKDLDEIEENVQSQAVEATKKADLLVFLVDAKEGLTHEDVSVAEIIRKSGKPFLFACNKSEGKSEVDIFDFSSLGLGVPIMISAAHKIGLGELLDKISEILANSNFKKSPKKKALKKKEFALLS